MIDSQDILATFQLTASRVVKFVMETKPSEGSGKVNQSIKFDYDVLKVEETQNSYNGAIIFKIQISIKKGRTNIIKLLYISEGIFIGNKNDLSLNSFNEMMKINGVAVLMQIGRAYILSTTATAGIMPPIRIPMVNVYRLKENKENKEPRKES